MHKQVSGCTVNFGPNFPESPFLESQTRKPPPPPISENFRFGMTKVYSKIIFRPESPPPLYRASPPPPISENFRFGMTKVYSRKSPPPPISENFRFWMTKVYSGIPPPPPEGLRMPRVTTCGDFIQPG